MVQRIGFKIWDHDDAILSEDEMERYELKKRASELIALIEHVSSRKGGEKADGTDAIIAKAYSILEDEAWKRSIPEVGVTDIGTGLLKETWVYSRNDLLDALDSVIAQHETISF